MPEEEKSPEGVVTSGALGKVGEIGVHRGEEGLAEAGTLGERNASWDRGGNDPSEDGENQDGQVQLEFYTLRDLETHAWGVSSGGGCAKHSALTCEGGKGSCEQREGKRREGEEVREQL